MDTDTVTKLAQMYVAHTGLKLSTVSSYATNDGKWLGSIENGAAGCTVRRLKRVIGWFSDHWPSDLDWPADIKRPSKSQEAA